MTLTPEQKRAVDSNAPHILCVAGAGSGKTRTLVARIQRLVAEGADPARMVAITFTNGAAGEMQERLGETRLAYIGTLHGYCLRFIRQAGEAICYGNRVTVITKEQAEDLIERAAVECRFKGTQEELAAAVKSGSLALRLASKAGRSLTKAEVVAALYYRLLREGQMIDFDGILFAACELLSFHDAQPQPTPTHLFVDETQDGSDVDFDIYELLEAQHKFYVGDSDQAIYGFRGGAVANITDMAKPGSGAEVHYLESNFRCASTICEAAQRLIENNPGRPEKRTVSATGLRGNVDATPYKDAYCEWQGVFAGVRASLTAGIAPGEIAILTRTNKLAREFSDFLEAGGVSVAKKKRQSRPEDWPRLAALVALLANPDNDTLALYHIEKAFGVEARQKAHMKALDAMQTVNEAVLQLPYGAGMEAIAEVASRAGIGAEAIDKLDGIIRRLPTGTSLDELTFAMSRDEFAEGEMGAGVTVTTAHSAKGREWGFVFLPSFEQGIFPQGRKDTDLAEERRLAYVAMTRAKESLRISYTEERVPAWGDRRAVPAQPSQFIAEAGL